MLTPVTWRTWAVITATVAAYALLGFWLDGNGALEAGLYKWGLLAASVTPFLLIGVYTATGNQWWSNDIGAVMVQLKICIALLTIPLAYVFFFDGGVLLPGWLAWAEVSAPALVAAALLRMCWIFWRISRRTRK